MFFHLTRCISRMHFEERNDDARAKNRALVRANALKLELYTKYPIVERALGLAAECTRVQRYLANTYTN